MEETVFRLPDVPWTPYVVREGDELFLRLAQYSDSADTVGEFRFPARQEHVDAMRASLPRHLLLRPALNRVCRHSGRSDAFQPDADRAREAIDTVLLAAEKEVEAWFAQERALRTPVDRRSLISHAADPVLLKAGRLFDALEAADPVKDWSRVERAEGRA